MSVTMSRSNGALRHTGCRCQESTGWLHTVSLVVTLALSILVAPHATDAQQAKKVPRIGVLVLGSPPSAPDWKQHSPFLQELRDRGWIEGQTIALEYRWAAGHVDRLPALAAELVRLQVDLIVAGTGPAIRAAKDATASIPIVMTAVPDPVRAGFVASLARPGGNLTGISNIQMELADKHLELLRTLLPTLSRVAFLGYSGGGVPPGGFIKGTQDAAERLGMQVQLVVIGSVEEMESAFVALSRERAEALMVQPLFMGLGQGQRIADLAVQHRLPTISAGGSFADVGGLLFYGPDFLASSRRAAVFVDKILKGAKPGDLPVEQPMKFELVINLKTAKALDLTIPPVLLFQADKVLQ
jgi:putative tryptophan/tyrosine transport system substrate-binding protein